MIQLTLHGGNAGRAFDVDAVSQTSRMGTLVSARRLLELTMRRYAQLEREILFARIRGNPEYARILEVGAGTGVNLPLYASPAIKTLTAVEPNPETFDYLRRVCCTVPFVQNFLKRLQ